jgi:hypothetical protein
MATKVFVSAGTPGDASQEAFRDSVVNAIEMAGLIPRLMTDRDWDRINPLRGVRRAMEECFGAIVIAYARYRFPSGLELRKDGARQLQDVSFPTAWNQIEAARAYERGFPLLVIAQRGLREDAFLESTADVRPFWTDLGSDVRNAKGFVGYLQGWKLDVEAFAAAEASRRQQPAQEVTIRTLVLSLPWYEALALAATVLGTVAAAVSVGYRIGAGQWPLG